MGLLGGEGYFLKYCEKGKSNKSYTKATLKGSRYIEL